MIGERAGFGEEIFEGWLFDGFDLGVGAIAGIEIFLEKRAEVDFLEGIFLLGEIGIGLFGSCRLGLPVALFFVTRHIVDQRYGRIQFLEDRVLDHLGVDHVLELNLIESQNADHLHQTRCEDLLLADLKTELVLKKYHCDPLPLTFRRASNPGMRRQMPHSSLKPARSFPLDRRASLPDRCRVPQVFLPGRSFPR